MLLKNRLLAHLFFVFFMVSSFSGAETNQGFSSSRSLTKTGIQVLRFRGGNTDSGTQGLMVGFRTHRYLYKGFSLGVEAMAGAPEDGSIVDNNLLFTGVSMGWDTSFLKFMTLELNALIGYGYGKSTNLNVSGDGFTVHPQLGLGFLLVDGYRITFQPGYLYMPRTNSFSGFTFSLRFDRKYSSSAAKPIQE